MKLRRAIRTSIQRGTEVHAVVEEYALGRATVRLAPNGAKLTNLSTLGKEVSPGETVIVDYSAGVTPVVRPEFLETADDVVLATLYEETEKEIPDAGEVGDHGCYVVRYGSFEDGIKAYKGTPIKIPFSVNHPDWPDFPVLWDTDNHHDYVDTFGRDHVIVKHPGKYFLAAGWSDYVDQYYENPMSGYLRIRILVNGSPVAVMYSAEEHWDYNNPSPSVATFWPLEEGDKVSLELFQTVEHAYWFDNWGGAKVDMRQLCIQYLPGTLVPT